MQWRFAREALRSPELGVSRFTYEPGARMPWGHRHRVQEEAYVVVVIRSCQLDDDVVELWSGMCRESLRSWLRRPWP